MPCLFTNIRASFQIWRKENLIKHQKVGNIINNRVRIGEYCTDKVMVSIYIFVSVKEQKNAGALWSIPYV